MVGTFITYCRATVHSLVQGGAKLHEDLLRTVILEIAVTDPAT